MWDRDDDSTHSCVSSITRALFDCCTVTDRAAAMRDMEPILLRFRDPVLETKFRNRKDSTFKFYIACAFVIYLFIVTVQLILLSGSACLCRSLYEAPPTQAPAARVGGASRTLSV